VKIWLHFFLTSSLSGLIQLNTRVLSLRVCQVEENFTISNRNQTPRQRYRLLGAYERLRTEIPIYRYSQTQRHKLRWKQQLRCIEVTHFGHLRVSSEDQCREWNNYDTRFILKRQLLPKYFFFFPFFFETCHSNNMHLAGWDRNARRNVGTSLHRMLAMGQQSLDLSRVRYHGVAKTDVLTTSSTKIPVI
jgi:hypothetical protein